VAADLELQIWAVLGASGVGKGIWLKQQLKRLNPPRLVIWDFKKEYDGWGKLVTSLREVRAAMMKAGEGPLRIRYVTQKSGRKDMQADFEALCDLVYAWQHCVFIAEELVNVTTPSWAPGSWLKMTTSGRHEGIHIIGVTQSPALVDKTFLGNATLVHACWLKQARHRKVVAADIDIDVAELDGLLKYQYIEKNTDTREVVRGVVYEPWMKTRPVPPPTPGQKTTPPARKTAPPEAPSPRRAKRSPSDSRTPSRRATSDR
jgi:hypothetical protein